MEKATLDMSAGMVFLGGFCSKPKSGGQVRIRFSTEMSSSEKRVKACNLITTSSGENSNVLAPKSSWGLSTSIKGSHDPYPWISSRESCVLDVEEDEYGGVIVKPEGLPKMADAFATMLQSSLFSWKLKACSKGKKGIWLRLPLDKADLVPIAVKEGFKYHHAEQTSAEDVWKLPTGFILENEEIFDGAVREVKEETGVSKAVLFVVIICSIYKHAHQVAFQKSDLFFICLLKPLSTKIAIDEVEIQAAKWMPLAEFVSQPCIQEDVMFKKIVDICIAWLRKSYCGLAAHHVISKFDARSSTLYCNVVEPEDYSSPELL
ncbi:hypothetical protein HPP92_020532 [Vanilla planifolia]|uniref:Nudix hydrolase domain-containing protein n=1 Tax=Vanilla planifolia TaxID=51239 RepID=A0A835UJV6_VANPL|nr:hypothetical protein HPP92_020532 [Vanilla planifolia]